MAMLWFPRAKLIIIIIIIIITIPLFPIELLQLKLLFYYYYYQFSSGNRSMAILGDRQSGYIHLIYPTFNVSISVVVAQRV